MKRLYNSLGVILLLISNYSFSQSTDCPENLTISTDVLSGQTRLFQSSNSITGTNTIQANANATYDAGTEITLSDGFDAIKGSGFDALINGCIPNPDRLPNDPLFTLQWGHHNLGSDSPENHPYAFSFHTDCTTAEITPPIGVNDIDTNILDVWRDITKGSEDITIAILDSGLDIHHPDINLNRIVASQNFTATGAITDVTDTIGHGTHVVGLIAAEVNNNIGIAGIDQNCKIMPVKIEPAEFPQITKAIRYAINEERGSNKANIISMSFGNQSDFPIETKKALSEAIEAGTVLIAATGNDNTNEVDFPAQYSEVIGVGALSPCNTRKSRASCDQDDRKEKSNLPPWGSNYGVGMDVLAPGTLIPSTDITGIDQGLSGSLNCDRGSCYTSCIKTSNSHIFTNINGEYVIDGFGTSIATPYVAGIASLMLAANKDLKNYQVQHIIKESAKTTSDGFKRVDALSAVEMAKNFDPSSDFLLPDLQIENIEVSQTILLGESLQLNFEVKNDGDKQTGSVLLNYVIKDIADNFLVNETLNLGDFLAGENKSFNISELILCNSFDPDKDYTISLNIDPNNSIHEINELNNEFSSSYTVANIFPDLVIDNPKLLTKNDGSVAIKYTIKNIGKGKANFSGSQLQPYDEFYLSNDTIIDSKDRLLSTHDLRLISYNLCQNESKNTAEFNLPNDFTENYIIIRLLPNNQFTESNYDNNFGVLDLRSNVFALTDNHNSGSNTSNLIKKEDANGVTTNLSISPNPSKNMVSILVPKKGIINVMDITGALISTHSITDDLLNLNIGSYTKGLYLIEYIDTSGNRSIKKLIKN